MSNFIKRKSFIGLVLLMVALGAVGLATQVFADPTVTLTQGTTGPSVSMDTSTQATSPSYSMLSSLQLTETASGQIATGTHTFTLPTGWEFKVDQDITIVKTGDGELDLASLVITPATTSFSFVVSTASSGVTTNDLVFTSVFVIPSGTTPSTGNMTATAGTITGITNGVTSLASLVTEAGNATSMSAETTADGLGDPIADQVLSPAGSFTIYAIQRDQFNNFVANDAEWSIINSTGGIGAPDLIADNGSGTYTGRLVGTGTLHIQNGGGLVSDDVNITVNLGVPSVPSNGDSVEADGYIDAGEEGGFTSLNVDLSGTGAFASTAVTVNLLLNNAIVETQNTSTWDEASPIAFSDWTLDEGATQDFKVRVNYGADTQDSEVLHLLVDTDVPTGYVIATDSFVITENNASFDIANAEFPGTYIYVFDSNDHELILEDLMLRIEAELTVTNAGAPTATTGTTTNVGPIDLSTLSDGTIYAYVLIIDPASNMGGLSPFSIATKSADAGGYTVSINQALINDANKSSMSFTFADATPAATYSYTVTSSGGGGTVSDSGTTTGATDTISNIDVSGLPDGTLTLTVTHEGTDATDTVVKDATAPTGYTVDFDSAYINNATKATASFSFAGAQVGATYSYSISSSGGGTAVTGSGLIATATDQIAGIDVTGLTDGTLTITATLTDPNGNTGSNATDTAIKDIVAPTVAITDDEDGTANIAGGSVTYTFTFSQAVTGFASGDITVVNGTKGAFATTSSSVYTLVVTPDADLAGNMTVDVAGGVATDLAGNNNTVATQSVQVVDTLAPTVAITDDEAGVATIAGGTVTYTFTFSQAVTTFVIGDITVANGTKGEFNANSSTEYTLVVTPTADFAGNLTVDVAGDMAIDANSNGNTVATQSVQVVDTLAPTLVITDDHASYATIASPTVSYTFTFSQAVSGFTTSDIIVTNGTKVDDFATSSSSVYTISVVPTASFEGNMTVAVTSSVATDANGNGNTAATTNSQVVDTLAPTVAVTDNETGVANIAGGTVTYTFTFSAAVSGFTIGDITVVNGTKGAFATTSSSVYTLIVTPDADLEDDMTVDVAGSVATDVAGNNNTAATTNTQAVDTLAPIVTAGNVSIEGTPSGLDGQYIAGDVLTAYWDNSVASGDANVDIATVSFDFSEFGGGDVAGTDDSDTWSAEYTILAGTIDDVDSLNVAVTATDEDANPTTTSGADDLTVDNKAPSVAITDNVSGTANITDATISYTFTFSEAVTGFTIDDITVVNGLTSDFATTSNLVYTAVVTPTAELEDDMTVDVDTEVAVDSAGNENTVATTNTQAVDYVAPTSYTVSIDQASIGNSNRTAMSFTFAGAEVDATYEYTVTSSVGSGSVTDTATISSATQQITGIDVSDLSAGTLTLSVVLTDTNDNAGTAVTDTVIYAISSGGGSVGGGATAPTAISASNVPLAITNTQKGTLTQNFDDGSKLVVDVPTGAVAGTTTMTSALGALTADNTPVSTIGAVMVGGHVFNITATSGGSAVRNFNGNLTITLSVPSLPNDLPDLGVYYFNESTNQWDAVPGAVFNLTTNSVTFQVNHLTKFAIFQVANVPANLKTATTGQAPATPAATPTANATDREKQFEMIIIESNMVFARLLPSGTVVNATLETQYQTKSEQVLIGFSALSAESKKAIVNFVTYGSDTTYILGAGERLGVINSFAAAYDKLPQTLVDWQDVLKIANGRWPSATSTKGLDRAKGNFKTIYKREPNMANANDNAAVTIMAYGLRNSARNMNSEKVAILSFKKIFGFAPTKATNWDAVRAIAYSGATR